jgi:hypothetical protein
VDRASSPVVSSEGALSSLEGFSPEVFWVLGSSVAVGSSAGVDASSLVVCVGCSAAGSEVAAGSCARAATGAATSRTSIRTVIFSVFMCMKDGTLLS